MKLVIKSLLNTKKYRYSHKNKGTMGNPYTRIILNLFNDFNFNACLCWGLVVHFAIAMQTG